MRNKTSNLTHSDVYGAHIW